MGNKLTPAEILHALADGKEIRLLNNIYWIDHEGIFGSRKVDSDIHTRADMSINCLILSRGCAIYTPPEKPKSLSEKFIEMIKSQEEYGEGFHKSMMIQNIYNWIKEQEGKDEA